MPKPSPAWQQASKTIWKICKSHGAMLPASWRLPWSLSAMCMPILSHWGLHGNAILAQNFNNLAIRRNSKTTSHQGNKHGSKNQSLGFLTFLTSLFLLMQKLKHEWSAFWECFLPHRWNVQMSSLFQPLHDLVNRLPSRVLSHSA